MKRRHDVLLVYVDQGRYSGVRLGVGSTVFHRKDSIVSPIHIDEDYRVLYIYMKRPAATASIEKLTPYLTLLAQAMKQPK
jgi:hypothetical protein